MQLHHSWTVLVTIVWTILHHGSVKGSIADRSRGRLLENPQNEYESRRSTFRQRDGNTLYNDSHSKSEDEDDKMFVAKKFDKTQDVNIDVTTVYSQKQSYGFDDSGAANFFARTPNFRKDKTNPTVNRNSTKEYRIHRSGVKNSLTESQAKNRDNKGLVSRTAAREINLTQQLQLRRHVQDQKKREQKLVAEMDQLGKDVSLTQENGATALENSIGFSLAVEVQRNDNILNSIASVSPARTRKVTFSNNGLDDTPAFRKIRTDRSGGIMSGVTAAEPLGSSRFPHTAVHKGSENNVGAMEHPVAPGRIISTSFSLPKRHLGDFGTHGDDKKHDRSNEIAEAFYLERCGHQHSKPFSHHLDNALESQKGFENTPGGIIKNGDFDSAIVTPDGQRKRKRWKDKITDAINAGNAQSSTLNKFSSPLLKGRSEEIANITRANGLAEKNVREDKDDTMNVVLPKQANYIRKVKIDKATKVSTVHRENVAVPPDYGNFSAYASLQTRSPSTGSRRRKSVGHDQRNNSLTSSTKTVGATWSIDRPPYYDSHFMGKVLLPDSHSRVSGITDYDGKLPNNSFSEQIKRGFTTVTGTHFSGSIPSSNVTTSEDRDIKSTETITRTTDGVVTDFESMRTYTPVTESGSHRRIETLPREITSIPLVQLSNENSAALGTSNHNPEFVKPFEREKSLVVRGINESSNLQKPRNKQSPENAGIVIGARNTQTFNYTANANSTRVTATLNQWPVKYSAVVEGDLVLGGLMMVHEREDSITCGPVMPQGGVQALEAMLYTLDWVNKRDLVPGVKIGAHILDDCDKDTYGLEMAVDFIKGSISNIDGAEYHCNKTAVRKVISGVVGAASSVTSIQVANLLRLFRIPQVSFFSTSPELSNKMRFEYFTRTIPSDHYQVKAMVDIVLLMGWSYVSIIYEESNYGEKAYEELEKLLGKNRICIAVKEKLSKDSGVAKAHVYDNIVLKLLTKPRARGCIIFASDQEVAGVMKAVRRCNATGAFSWIGSDGWSARSLVSDGNEPEMEGTLSVQPQANPVEGFEDYFLNLTVENNRRNPWFVEFWEDHFKCRYPNASQTPYNNYTKECTTTESLTKQNTAFENQLQFVSDAVMAFAYALRNMHADFCHGRRGLCDAMKPTKGTELLNYLRTVQFKGLSGDVFHFDKNGDGPARYNIIHFKQVSPGKYKWIRVGKYLEGELRLNTSEIQFRLGHPEPPESVCSLPCEVGQAKKYVEGESCCWHCFNCTQYQIRHETDEKQCVLCPQGTVPDEMHSYCRDIPENFLRPESGWAIGAMSFSSTGILITLFVGGVFLKHNDTPIVRASGRELSYVLLTGILLCYLVTFALVLRPNDLVCSIQRFSAGFCFTVVYAALLTKTNRISRIFNAGKHSAKRPSFISPRSQLIICSMLVGVQILINGVWMVIDPARAMHHYPTREDNLLVCNSYMNASYMIAFTYPIILIVVCTVYAVLTRKIPEAFNESKHIGFTMYTTCVIWLAFVPLYFATGSQVALRITSMSVTISLSASVTIACLFTPKLYIILIHPERNVRPNMMMTRYNTTKGSAVTATNASSMMAPVTLTAVTCDQNKAVNKHVIATMDCSTQSEQFELEAKDKKNRRVPPAVVTRSTQTHLNNNGKESGAVTSPTIKDIGKEEDHPAAKGLNIAKIGNGPLSQNELPL